MRNKKGITQSQLAEIVNIDPKHMSHIETGRSFPKSDLIEKLADALDIEYRSFFKTEHLQDKKFIIEKINNYLNKANKNELQKIFIIITGLME